MNTFFSDKIILWQKMTKIWLKIWLKVKENGTKKIKLAKMVAKEKKILVRTLCPQFQMELMGHIILPSFVHASVCPYVKLFSACHILRTLHARVLKFYIWVPNEKNS